MAADARIAEAARVLATGGLVGFPTETVYGLGADASNPDAVRRVFAAKGRPTSHPLIVHVASPDALDALARDVSESARVLARRFWPGPLTLVLARGERVPSVVTGGQETVAVRVPDHPVALALLAAFGGGVAAPSANRFGRVSPTTAEHVRTELGDAVDLVLDGGACAVGIESTIVDLSRGRPRLLRSGAVSAEALEAALGEPVTIETAGPIRAPGQLPSHYAPRAEVIVVAAGELAGRAAALQQRGARLGVLLLEGEVEPPGVRALRMPVEPRDYARALYAALRALDDAGADVILAMPPAAREIGAAVVDRLERAAGPRGADPPAAARETPPKPARSEVDST